MPPNPSERPQWPPLPSSTQPSELEVELFKQKLAEIAARRKEFETARHESRVAIENSQIEVTKGALERARDSAKYIQTAASAIAALYTGVAALIFKVDSDHPLPVRGVIPIAFLGAAIVFSSIYLTWFISGGGFLRPFPIGIDATQLRVDRVQWFSDWVTLGVLSKAWALRAATLSLAAGLLFLAAPFIPTRSASSSTSEQTAVTLERNDSNVARIRFSTGPPRPAASKVPTTATATTLPPWPVAPSGDSSLEAILYKAQVQEAAKLRAAALAKGQKTPTAQSSTKINERLIWIFAAVVAVAIAWYVNYEQTKGSLHRALTAITWKPEETGSEESEAASGTPGTATTTL